MFKVQTIFAVEDVSDMFDCKVMPTVRHLFKYIIQFDYVI